MLILSRHKHESVVVPGANLIVRVVEIRGDKVRLGFIAPKDLQVHREEVWAAICRDQHPANEETTA